MNDFYVVELPDPDAPLYLSSEGTWASLSGASKFVSEHSAGEHLNLCPDGTLGVVVHSDVLDCSTV